MAVDLARDLVPDELWKIAAPLIPPFRPHPQGGGTVPVADRKLFTAVVYVLTSGCARQYLPPTSGTSPATPHRRFAAWTRAGLWRRLHRAVLDDLSARGALDWTSAIIDAASVRTKRGTRPPGRTRSIATRRAASCIRCPKRRASPWLSQCPVRTCMTARRSSRCPWPFPPYAPGAGRDESV
ncbi:transposase [Streptomyces sp. NPDC059272]|uniref:transposase n=1 Tax=Streptomyces sp. NPDC059272 TaxID=3346800 RepID=UPI0036A68572